MPIAGKKHPRNPSRLPFPSIQESELVAALEEAANSLAAVKATATIDDALKKTGSNTVSSSSI